MTSNAKPFRQVLNERPDTFLALLLVVVKQHGDVYEFRKEDVLALTEADLDNYMVSMNHDDTAIRVYLRNDI